MVANKYFAVFDGIRFGINRTVFTQSWLGDYRAAL
jgi:hypothetical protein